MKAPAAGVLLIDLENMIGQQARPKTLTPRLDALLRHAGSVPEIVAACAQGRITAQGKQILRDRSVRLLVVDGAKDAADLALLEEARRLAAGGHRRFVVASADAAFAKIAELGQLEIMLWDDQEPRKNAYTDRADKVHRVIRPRGKPTPKKAAPREKLAPSVPRSALSAPPITSTAAPATAAPATVTVSPKAAPSPAEAPEAPWPSADGPAAPRLSSEEAARLLLPRHAGAVGVACLRAGAVFAAGTLFGAGTIVGAHAARHLLRSLER